MKLGLNIVFGHLHFEEMKTEEKDIGSFKNLTEEEFVPETILDARIEWVSGKLLGPHWISMCLEASLQWLRNYNGHWL